MLLKSNESITKKIYDVVVIGGGLGGLTAANVLGRSGRSVLLLEAHNKLGGFATWFHRESVEQKDQEERHTFDVSLHGFPVGMIKTCRRYWNQDIADSIVQLQRIRFINPQFNLETNFTREDFMHKLVHHFNISPQTVEAFFQHLKEINFYDTRYQKMPIGELFEQYFPGRNDVVRFLLEPITYANGHTLQDPALSFAIVFSNFMNKGVFTFQGSTDQVIKKMRDELLRNNVDIKLQAEVSEILVEKGKVRGVLLKKGQEVASRTVISNAHITSTLKMSGRQSFKDEFWHQGLEVRINSSSCQVYMGLKKETPFFNQGDLIFTSTYPIYDAEKLLDKKTTSRTFSLYTQEHRPQHPFKAIVCSTNARYADWCNLSPESYQQQKKILEEETLQELEKILPSVRSWVEIIESATPLTIERYTRHPKGTSFGTKFEGLALSTSLPEEISGLFHCGSVGIIMSGWLGAANYGAITAHKVEIYLGSTP